MAREIDEAFIEQAIERYQRLETRFGEFDRALSRVEVTVSSPDGLVDVVVGGDGRIRDVTINGTGGGPAQLSRSVRQAVAAAADAAAWARAKLHAETFGEYRPLGEG
jgi:DNA-binding protein YbaB